MRSRALFLTALAAFGTLALPVLAHATTIPYFGPIVPSLNATCAGAWGGLVQMLNNVVALLITLAITALAPVMIAYAGFLYVVSPVNASDRRKANDVLKSTIIGIIIALAGWLIVNAVLSALTSKGVSDWTSTMFSNGAPACLSIQTDTFNQAPSTGVTTGTGGASNAPLSASGSGPCDASVVSSAASQAGYPLSNVQANELACIARYESTCGTKNPPYNLNYSWNKPNGEGKASTAAGAFQVLLSSNSTCYDNSVCESAAGTPGTVLNCKAAFDSNGFTKSDAASQDTLTKCKQAAGNIQCSAAAAACLLQHQSFTSAYSADSNVTSCANQYGG